MQATDMGLKMQDRNMGYKRFSFVTVICLTLLDFTHIYPSWNLYNSNKRWQTRRHPVFQMTSVQYTASAITDLYWTALCHKAHRNVGITPKFNRKSVSATYIMRNWFVTDIGPFTEISATITINNCSFLWVPRKSSDLETSLVLLSTVREQHKTNLSEKKRC